MGAVGGVLMAWALREPLVAFLPGAVLLGPVAIFLGIVWSVIRISKLV